MQPWQGSQSPLNWIPEARAPLAPAGWTLTAGTTGISDADGRTNAAFSYQWIRNSSTTDIAIENATSSTYVLQDADEGNAVRVRVNFTDDAGNSETLTSAATGVVVPAPVPVVEVTPTPPISPTPPTPLTARFLNTPSSHSGGPFTFELRFSEAPRSDFSYVTLRERAFTVTGGTIARTPRLEKSRNIRWGIMVEPTGSESVSISLPATTDCGASGAICTEDGRKLSSAVSLTVGYVAPSPLTAQFLNTPSSHSGGPFTFELRFSEAPRSDFSYVTLRERAFTVTGGTIEKSSRLEQPGNVRWEITVEPTGDDDVTVTLPATTNCSSSGSICTGDGRKLSAAISLTVAGP